MSFRLHHRLLGDVNSPSPSTQAKKTSEVDNLDSDFVVILAALLCALICVLGLVAVARCAWIRRISTRVAGNLGAAVAPPPPANKGLKKKVLKALPKHSYSSEDTGKLSDCAICLTEFVIGDELRVLPQCGHGFHVVCIDTWLGSHSSCPSCRQILVASSRCQKCGEFPAECSSSSAAQPDTAASTQTQREDQINRFLP